MSSLSSLYRELRQYRQIRDKVVSVRRKVEESISPLGTVADRVIEGYSINEVRADQGYLTRVYDKEKEIISQIQNRVIPNVDDHIDWIIREIDRLESEDDD